MPNYLKQFTKKAFNQIGLDIVKKAKNPTYSLVGLRDLPIKTIIDVGANKGQFAKKILPIFPNANIFCFEPLPESFKELRQWAEKHGEGRIKAYSLALGDTEQTLEISRHDDHSPSSSFLTPTAFSEDLFPFTQKRSSALVEQTTLDTWAKTIPEFHFSEMLIKLDVQGYEDRVIKGGRKTFTRAKACITEVCLDQLYEGQATFRDISSLFHDLGYRYAGNLFQSYANDGHIVYIDAIFLK